MEEAERLHLELPLKKVEFLEVLSAFIRHIIRNYLICFLDWIYRY